MAGRIEFIIVVLEYSAGAKACADVLVGVAFALADVIGYFLPVVINDGIRFGSFENRTGACYFLDQVLASIHGYIHRLGQAVVGVVCGKVIVV